jgi:hypothetical protein
MPRLAHARTVVAAATAALSALSLLAFALRSPGYPARTVDLNDSGIWVTSDRDGLVGRLNKSASSLDAMINPPGGAQASYALDVYQDRDTVLARDEGAGKLMPIDVRTAKIAPDSAVPMSPTAVMDMRGGTVAALDPTTGKILAARYGTADLPSLQGLGESAKPVAQLGKATEPAGRAGAARSAIAVSSDGTVYAADLAGKLVSVAANGSGLAPAASASMPAVTSIELSTVGPHVVVLDAAAGTVSIDRGAPVSLGGVTPGARLQQPGPDAKDVMVATAKGLYAVPVAGGPPTAVYAGASGAPAAPVRLGTCVYSAWAGNPGQVVKRCGSTPAVNLTMDRQHGLTRPVFRINRNQVVVNDAADGRVYDLDLKRSVDNWQQIKPPDPVTDRQQRPQKQKVSVTSKQKPKANRDDLGARPGRTTLLHVLDNDSDKSNRVLSITSVTKPGNPNATVTVAPDGQSLVYTLTAAGGDSDFQYRISDGLADATGDVHVSAHGPGVNSPPYRRATDQPQLTVSSGATLPVQVLPDWRDPDGDPVALQRVDARAGTVAMTSDGKIDYTAPSTGKGGTQKLTYAVSDGRTAKPTAATLSIRVLPPTATHGVAAITEPDVATGEVGHTIAIAPLANDVPGSDPLNPRATLHLSAPVGAVSGVKVNSDLTSGQITVTPSRVGAFFLSYSVGFGSAPLATGQIRVNADAATKKAPPPVAMPDTAAVHGQGAVLVDVLANDVDPTGSVLTVQAAQADAPDQVQVAVVRGRWLRLTPSTARFTTNPQTVRYQVTNGLAAPVDGTVSLTQLPDISPDSVITRPDYATVRDGDSTLVQVLDNDATLSGAPLSLLSDVPGAPSAGRLTVLDPAAEHATGGDLGSAYVAGTAIRYVAPTRVRQPRTLDIEYVAQTEAGDRASGTLEVTVNPQPDAQNSDRAPTPTPIDARATAGQTLGIPIPATGADPDGDSTSVVGIASAPALGRVTGLGPTTITYQAYPDTEGTDSFSYTVTDRYGKQASSLIRVAVVPPGAPAPAVAAPISITSRPGAHVTVYPLTGAYYLATDPVKVLPLADTNKTVPRGVRLDPADNAVTATAPAAGARPLQVSFALSGNAGPGVPSTITVRSQEGFKNPPRVRDTTAKTTGSPTATADVLATAYDPDGDPTKLTVTRVADPRATIDAGKVTLPVTDRPQAVPYEVTDESGAVSSAVIYVPARGSGGPYVKSGAVIHVPPGAATTVPLADYVADPRGRTVSLTTTDQIWASPLAEVNVAAKGDSRLTIVPTKDYTGPGAVVVEVTDGKTLDDPAGIRAVVSIPVQVGPETPVLRCPNDPVDVVAGGQDVDLDITSVCSVWTPTTEMADALSYTARWSTAVQGVTATARGRTVALGASGAARPQATGTLLIGAAGTRAAPAPLPVKVLAAPKPTLAPIQLQEMKQGDTRTVDLRDHLSSPLRDKSPTAVSITKVSGQSAATSVSGSTVTITPGASSHGRMTFTVVASDVAGTTRTDRQVNGVIAFDVFGVPDAPSRVQPGTSILSGSASVSWATPAANGAPIDSYEVSWSGGTQPCAASPCTITGLTNGTAYTFRVRAHNKAGFSDHSPSSAAYTPDEAPQQVPNFTQTAADDHSVTLSWGAAVDHGSPVSDYIISVDGRTVSAGTALTTTVSGLTNGQAYTFTIVAKNSYKAGPATTTTGYAAGSPIFAGPVTPQDAHPADADTTAVTVTWGTAQANGPEAPTYTLTRTGGSGTKTVCTDVSVTTCQDQGVSFGTTYTYSVAARTVFLNQTRTSSSASASPYTPVGRPGAWQPISATATGTNNQISVTFTVPPSRGTSSTVSVRLNGSVSAGLGSFPVGGSGSTTRTVSVPANGTDYSLSLQDCNENSQCSVSNSITVNAYGPIPAPSISLSKVGPTTLRITASADGNGRPISIQVLTTHGNSWTFTTLGAWSWVHDYVVPYGTDEQAHLGITDSAGRPTPPQVHSQVQSSDPLPVSVSVSKGASAVGRSGCSDPSCAFIVATTANFTSNVSCTANSREGSGGFFSWTQGANATRQSPDYYGYPGGWVSVTCTDGQGHSATGRLTW